MLGLCFVWLPCPHHQHRGKNIYTTRIQIVNNIIKNKIQETAETPLTDNQQKKVDRGELLCACSTVSLCHSKVSSTMD